MTDPTLYAVALADPGAFFSQRAHPFVAVLSGTLRRRDEVEIISADGTVRRATIESVPRRSLSAVDPDGQITFLDLSREDVTAGDIIRSPGLKTPPLAMSGETGLRRLGLLHSVKKARRTGFTTSYAKLLCRLPDDAVVLFLEKSVRDALSADRPAHNVKTAFEKAALLHEAVGLPEDGDRLRLAAAALLEGRPLGWTLPALPPGVAAGMATENGAKGPGWTLYEKLQSIHPEDKRELAAEGEALRRDLQQRGRAVALGWCGKCKGVVQLTPDLRCPQGHEQIKDVRVVVPSEVARTEHCLHRRHR